MLIARGKATKERHPGLGMMKEEPSAVAFSKMRLDPFGRKVRVEGDEKMKNEDRYLGLSKGRRVE
jgi:hypothetical protein